MQSEADLFLHLQGDVLQTWQCEIANIVNNIASKSISRNVVHSIWCKTAGLNVLECWSLRGEFVGNAIERASLEGQSNICVHQASHCEFIRELQLVTSLNSC
jgi:hypothetical protein